MKKSIVFSFVAGSLFLLGACGNPAEKTEENQPVSVYSYNNETSILEWTAFKFTERKGVKGTFNDFTIKGIKESTDPKELLQSLTFSIPVASTETNDPGRNEKIIKYFFKTINTENITGKLVKLNEDETADLQITMNGITKDVTGNYKLSDTQFSFTAMIDVLNWKGGNGVAALNAECIENHTGPDGVLKLWSEVDLSFTTTLNKK